MALSSCFLSSPLSVSPLRIDGYTRSPSTNSCNSRMSQRCKLSVQSSKTALFGQPGLRKNSNQFLGGSRNITLPNVERNAVSRKSSIVSLATSSQIAASAFTWGTVAVMPCYTLMIAAPQAKLTKKVMASSIPYLALGVLYGYLLYLSWTPDTIRYMFASKYLLPELPGIAKMFSSEMTLASAWIHLLAVDLFAARQVYFDGLQDNVETRHSVSLCLLFCPIGILTHFITKAVISSSSEKTERA